MESSDSVQCQGAEGKEQRPGELRHLLFPLKKKNWGATQTKVLDIFSTDRLTLTFRFETKARLGIRESAA